MEPIIEAKGIGKRYDITHQKGRYVALRDVITSVFARPFSFLKQKVKRAIGMETKEVFWALHDVNFAVKKGEIIGIIGRNGAGKSTLLKILSQITPPTTGEITIRGRVGSLLEVGTGFHPELTGRENIFLNGAILGMKKREIAEKFNEIVAFADIEQFLDTPVKYYSSGMYVRLAFSVAAHMEPDILIIDEVLAVGDAEFQKKCLKKMEKITKEEGRTILFVSHNMITVKNLCSQAILLSKGRVEMIGNTDEVIRAYENGNNRIAAATPIRLADSLRTEGVRFTEIEISDGAGNAEIKSGDPLSIRLAYDSDAAISIDDVRIVISIVSMQSGQIVLRLDSDITAKSFGGRLFPQGTVRCDISEQHLIEGSYSVNADLLVQGTSINHIKGIAEFPVVTSLKTYGYVRPPDATVCDYVSRYSFTKQEYPTDASSR